MTCLGEFQIANSDAKVEEVEKAMREKFKRQIPAKAKLFFEMPNETFCKLTNEDHVVAYSELPGKKVNELAQGSIFVFAEPSAKEELMEFVSDSKEKRMAKLFEVDAKGAHKDLGRFKIIDKKGSFDVISRISKYLAA